MTSAKAEILRLLPKLNAAELADVALALKATIAIGGAPGASQPAILHTDWLLNGFATYLIKDGQLTQAGAIWDLRKRSAYKTYQSHLIQLMPFLVHLMEKAGVRERSRPQLAYLCAEAEAALLRSWNIYSVGAMLSHINKIPEALDAAYPGYVRSGLFACVLGLAPKD